MPENRWDKVGALLEEAGKLPPDQRRAYLEEHCEEGGLREEVLSLLEAEGRAEGVFEYLRSTVSSFWGARDAETAGPWGGPGHDPLELEDQQVGRYEVDEHLGGGGMGIVYRARDPQLSRAVALKFLPPHLATVPEAVERFSREARAVAAITHPHIGQIYETGRTEEDRLFMAMAYYEGETLKEKIESGFLPVEEAVLLATQIAEGLAEAHQAGVVHRDVKPANVLVTTQNQVKLLDFGLAHLAKRSRITESGRRLGTAAYMSPEQAEGREVGPEADLWALGTVLYEMLAGRRPFCAGRETAVLHAVLYEEPSSLKEHRPDVPPALAQIVRRCLAKDPGRRYGSAGELIEDLASIGSPEGSLSMATSSWGWTEAESPPTSIAVLPFESLGGREAGPFTRGLHGDLITRLANVSGLKVIARTSVQQYRGVERTVEEIGRDLGTQWVLEGEIQEAGGELRVRGRLISTRDGRQAWTGTYRRALDAERLFELQAELTKDIVGSLEAELTPGETQRIERQTTQDLKAYGLYVRGRRELAQRMEGDMETAVDLFRRAIRQDSRFALAWAGLADTAGNEWWGYAGFDTLGVSPEEAAQRALELDPDLAEAHASMGLVHHRQRNGPAALRELQQAVQLKPSYAEAQNWLGRTCLVLGRPEMARRHLELAKELNPRHLLARHVLYDTYIICGKAEKTLEEVREQVRQYPEFPGARHAETRALYALGRYEEAREVAREHLPKSIDIPGTFEWRPAYLIAIETALGDTARARKRLATLKEREAPPIVMAYAHAAFEDVEPALTALEAIEDWTYVPTFSVRYMNFPEGLAQVRETSRYEGLIREINQYWGLRPDGAVPEEKSPL